LPGVGRGQGGGAEIASIFLWISQWGRSRADRTRSDFGARLVFITKKQRFVNNEQSRSQWAKSDLEWDEHGQLCFRIMDEYQPDYWNHTWTERDARVALRYGACHKIFKDYMCARFPRLAHMCDDCFDEARTPQFKYPTTTWDGLMQLFREPKESVRNMEWGVTVGPPQDALPPPSVVGAKRGREADEELP
jgi:hypothetical protein